MQDEIEKIILRDKSNNEKIIDLNILKENIKNNFFQEVKDDLLYILPNTILCSMAYKYNHDVINYMLYQNSNLITNSDIYLYVLELITGSLAGYYFMTFVENTKDYQTNIYKINTYQRKLKWHN